MTYFDLSKLKFGLNYCTECLNPNCNVTTVVLVIASKLVKLEISFALRCHWPHGNLLVCGTFFFFWVSCWNHGFFWASCLEPLL